MADKKKLGERVKLHHPKLGKEVVRTRRQAKLLAAAGWVEGALPKKAASTGGTGGGN